MAITTTTTLTEMVQAEVVSMAIKAYLIDAPVVNPLCEYASIAGQGTKVMSFPLITKDTGADITEATGLTNDDFDSSEVSVTVAQVGIYREVTEFAAKTVKLGEQALFNLILQDGVALVVEMLEDDLCALFASATGGTIGTSGADLTVANFVEAIAKMRTIKARGQYVCVLDDQQAYDLMAAVAASAGTVFSGGSAQSILNANSDGYVGALFGVPIWVTGLCDTANAGADVVGSMFVSGQSNPAHCPYSWVELWAPTVFQNTDPAIPSTKISTVFAYGCAITHPTAATKLVTDA